MKHDRKRESRRHGKEPKPRPEGEAASGTQGERFGAGSVTYNPKFDVGEFESAAPARGPEYPSHGTDVGRGVFEPDDRRSGDGERLRFGRGESEAARKARRPLHDDEQSDRRLSEEIAEHLTRDSAIDSRQLEISVQDGRVTIEGGVSSRETSDRIERIVAEVAGVREIENRLSEGNEGASRS